MTNGAGLPLVAWVLAYELKFATIKNRPLPAGEIGEICIKRHPGKDYLQEYYAVPEATAVARWNQRAGYIPGGRVTVDEDGYLFCRQTLQHD